MIAIYAEKFDVGVKISASLGGFDFEGTRVTMANVENLKERLEKTVKRQGFINVSFEGQDYTVTWGQGHMCGLKQAYDYNPEYKSWGAMPMPFIPPTYEIKIREGIDRETRRPTGQPDPWVSRQLDIVRDIFDQSEYIINATDDDREGETIFAYVYEILGCAKTYRRMIIDSQTESGLRKALLNTKPSADVKNIEAAGRGRGIADWVVGANLSAIMSLKYGGGNVLSIGRVQTPVLKLIVDREKAILSFVSHPFWYLEGTFTTGEGKTYTGKHEEAQIEKKEDAEAILQKIQGKPGVITSYKKEPIKKEVPFLYSFTTLAKAATKKYGFTSAETKDIAQNLYQAGYITYPRTVSQHLTDDMQNDVDEALDMLAQYSEEYKSYIDLVPKGSRNYTKRHFNSKLVKSHFAIIPTNVAPSNLTANQAKIYDLVARSLIKIIFKPASGERTKIVTTVEEENFKTSGTIITDEQWLVVDKEMGGEDLLPVLHEGDSVSGEYDIKEGKTQPPKRYDDDTIMTAMCTAGKDIDDEELKQILADTGDGGIGTSATRDAIIETLMMRKYTERKGNGKIKSIFPTELGMKLIDILPVDEIKSAKATAEWENRLRKIESGEDTLEDFVAGMEDITKKWVQEVQEAEGAELVKSDKGTNYVCPRCGKPINKYSWGYACSGYKKDDPEACRFAIGYDISGVTITDKDVDDLFTKKKTDRFIRGFSKKDSPDKYDAFLTIEEGGKLGRTWDVGINCPLCGKPITVGKKGWGCSGWKEGCKVTVWNEICGKKISDTDKRALLTKRQTKVIKGFIKKDGTSFDTMLVLGDDGKVSFPPKENN